MTNKKHMTNNRYALSDLGGGKWRCTDTIACISIEWYNRRFNATQQSSAAEPYDPVHMAKDARDMTEWLIANHAEKLCFGTRQEVVRHIRARVGAQIREKRESLHYTIDDLAELVGISPNHLRRIEDGKYSIDLDTLAVIGGGLGIDITLTLD